MVKFNAIPKNLSSPEIGRLDYVGFEKMERLLKKYGGKIDDQCCFRFPKYQRIEVALTVQWKRHRETLADLCRSVTPWIYSVQVKGS